MFDSWHIISQTSHDFPSQGQEIYCCIVDEEDVSEVRKIQYDIKAFEDLLNLHPKWKILWQPLATPPVPPSFSSVLSLRKEEPHGNEPH